MQKFISKFLYVFICLNFLLALTGTQPVYAAGIVVNTNADNLTDDGLCTLREAVINANNNLAIHDDCTAGAGDDVITFNLTGCPCTITLVSSQININSNITITGIGASNLILSGGGTNVIFSVGLSQTLNLSGVTITGGSNPSGTGGGIYTYNATLNISDSVISGNSAQHGGGIYTHSSTLTLLNSTVSNNTASGDGGGIYANGVATTTITNSTITGNSASGLGIAIVNGGTMTIRNSTIASNNTGGGTSGIYNIGSMTLSNTIVANSSCNSAVTNGGNNIDSGTTCGFSNVNGSQSSTDPMLNSLANNGGNTPTMSLQTGSPAIDAGDNTICAAAPVNNLDQRGVTRPFDGDGGGAVCDIGAYEVSDTTPPTVTSIVRASTSPTSASSVNFTVTFSENVTGVAVADFSLTTTGVSGASVTSVSGSNSTYTVSVNTGSGNGTIRLDVPNSATITDAFSNALSGLPFNTGEIYIVVKSPTFADVPDTYWAFPWIERLYAAGLTGGCTTSPLNYCPTLPVTRAEMAVFLERGLHGNSFTPPNVPATFGDTAGHWAEDWIEALKADGITGGCGGGNYCPNAPVTRAEMAVFLLRVMHSASYTPPNHAPTFGDSAGHWAEDWIEQLAIEGITSGCGGGNYCPNSPATRDQMAVFLVNAFSLP